MGHFTPNNRFNPVTSRILKISKNFKSFLKFSFLNLVKMPKRKATSNKDVYEKAEDLPEGRKKLYDSILEDFDKQVEARIEQIYSSIGAIQTQIRSQFKVAMLQQSRSVRSLKVEDFYYNDIGNSNSLDLTVECAKVAVSISNTVKNEVKTVEGRKKKSSILAQGPTMSGTRKSSRKRVASSLVSEVPLASSTLTAAALGGFSTMNPIRTKGRVAQLKTPSVELNGSTMITPKFDPATPLHRTAMRTQKAGEKFLVSMDGSPVYVGGRGGSRSKNENLIPVPIGNGKTLMVPSDDPEVQPIIQKLIKSCMNSMNKK